MSEQPMSYPRAVQMVQRRLSRVELSTLLTNHCFERQAEPHSKSGGDPKTAMNLAKRKNRFGSQPSHGSRVCSRAIFLGVGYQSIGGFDDRRGSKDEPDSALLEVVAQGDERHRLIER